MDRQVTGHTWDSVYFGWWHSDRAEGDWERNHSEGQRCIDCGKFITNDATRCKACNTAWGNDNRAEAKRLRRIVERRLGLS